MKILVINAGSSSLKYQLIDMTNEKVMAKGLVERIGIAGSNLVHKYGVDCGSKKKYEQAIANHTEAMKLVLDEAEFLPAGTAAPAAPFAPGDDEDYDALRDLNNT